jgi:uncharacterized protein
MSQSCPLPGDRSSAQGAIIERLLQSRRIAVVGLSDDPGRPSNSVGAYLQAQGYRIIPVNPSIPSALGEKAIKSLDQLDSPPDLVLVFRRGEHCAGVAEDAIRARARGLWLQSGIRNEEARRIAEQAGVDFVQDRCMMVEHMRRERPAGC